MTATSRFASQADLDGIWEVFRVCFGVADARRAEWVDTVDASRALVIDGPRGEIAAMSHIRRFDQWFGGRAVPMGGFSPVGVAPEHRGRGLARTVTAGQFASMRDHGEVISALFPASLALYRAVGFEVAGSYVLRRFPATHLASIRPQRPVDVRRGTPDDLGAVERCHAASLATRDGGLTRTTTHWRHDVPADLAATMLFVVDDPHRPGEIAGYATYRHGRARPPYDYSVVVHDVRADDPDALKALWRVVASSGSQAPDIDVIGPADDDLFLLAANVAPDTVRSELRWMLRIVDAPGAVGARGWPPGARGRVDLALHDDHAPWNAGRWTLEVADGEGRLSPGGSGDVEATIGGLSAWWSGYAPATRLARTGHLRGDRAALDALDALVPPAPGVLPDFF